MRGELTLSALYAEACRMLDSRFEAAQIFEHIAKIHVYELPHKGGAAATHKIADETLRMCEQRRTGVPLQYLLGEWEFYGLPFKVGRGVLIPRADTETLVDAAHALLKDTQAPEILDLCAGAGCIAIALASLRNSARITAVEYSSHALHFLETNIRLNSSQVQAVRADVHAYTHPRPLDLIVCNPPYIPSGDIAGLSRELHWEPRRALDGGADGLDFYKSISRRYYPQLKPGGWLCFEVGIHQAPAVRDILAAHDYREIQIHRDLAGIQRVVCARKALL